MAKYIIEYSIPPLRAIYRTEIKALGKAQAKRKFLSDEKAAKYRIRKIEEAAK